MTRAARYGVLQDAADIVLEELTARYTLERRETKELLTAGSDGPFARVVRLIPHAPAAAPMSVVFTDFPSVVLRLGRFYEQSLPGCGCDMCDEDPAELVDELHLTAAAAVEGGLWERVHRRLTGSWSEARLIGPAFTTTQRTRLDPGAARAARRDGFAAAVQWAPWPRRPEVVGAP